MIGASPHLYFEGGLALERPAELLQNAIVQAAPPERNGAPAILTLGHLARRMGIGYRALRAIAGDRKNGFYRDFTIRKRSGGGRRIAVPTPELMAVQRWIVREILRPQPVHPRSFAYAQSSSILDCAKQHAGAGWLLKLDIHDFFESISERSVYRVFRKIGYQPLVAFELARLCTRPWVAPPDNRVEARRVPNYRKRGIDFYQRAFTGYLPQGAPTSPMLSNLACARLDERLSAFAQREHLVYTRYSDDLTFSGTARSFDRPRAQRLVDEVRDLLLKDGFHLHEGKVSMVPPGARKTVLGLLVDRREPRLSPDWRARLADHVRGVEKFGLDAHAKAREFAAVVGMVNHIGGCLIYAAHIEPGFAAPLRQRFETALQVQGWTPPA